MNKKKTASRSVSPPSDVIESLLEATGDTDSLSDSKADMGQKLPPSMIVVPSRDPAVIAQHLRLLPHRGEQYYMQLSPDQYALLMSLSAAVSDLYEACVSAVVNSREMENDMQRKVDSGEEPAFYLKEGHMDLDVLGHYFPSFISSIESSYHVTFELSATRFPHEAELAYRLVWFVAQVADAESSKWFSVFRKTAEALVEFDRSFTCPVSMSDIIINFKLK